MHGNIQRDSRSPSAGEPEHSPSLLFRSDRISAYPHTVPCRCWRSGSIIPHSARSHPPVQCPPTIRGQLLVSIVPRCVGHLPIQLRQYPIHHSSYHLKAVLRRSGHDDGGDHQPEERTMHIGISISVRQPLLNDMPFPLHCPYELRHRTHVRLRVSSTNLSTSVAHD